MKESHKLSTHQHCAPSSTPQPSLPLAPNQEPPPSLRSGDWAMAWALPFPQPQPAKLSGWAHEMTLHVSRRQRWAYEGEEASAVKP